MTIGTRQERGESCAYQVMRLLLRYVRRHAVCTSIAIQGVKYVCAKNEALRKLQDTREGGDLACHHSLSPLSPSSNKKSLSHFRINSNNMSFMDTYIATLDSVGESILKWSDPEEQFRGFTNVSKDCSSHQS